MSSDESAESRQNNEFEALKAIYGDELKDLRGKAAWNRWTPLNLLISLVPQQGNSGLHENNATLDMHVICSPTYPDSVPEILLENSHGLSHADLNDLKCQLEKKTSILKGEEMIFQLAQHVQEFLHLHNKPLTKSFYDEMLQRQKEKEEKDLQAEKMEKDRQKQFMLEEIQKRQEILKSESKLRKESRYNSETSNEYDPQSNQSSGSLDDCSYEHKQGRILDFGNRDIQRGHCLRHSDNGHVSYTGIDRNSGEMLIVTEWTFETTTKTEISSILKQLSSIEQELNYLTKLKHPNLGHYLNILYNNTSEKVTAYILKEFVPGISCNFFFKQSSAINSELLKMIAKGVLNALDYLHRNNVVHKDIRENCIFIDDRGLVKLTNYSLHRRLLDLSSQTNTYTTYSKKSDIYKFGQFLVSLLEGMPQNEENLEIPESISPDLYDFLTKCLSKQEKSRFTAAQLLNHQFFRTPSIDFSPMKHRTRAQSQERHPSPTDNTVENFPESHQFPVQSRINNEFEFIQHLGKGAFGDVIKVRNKLDGGNYAIKRIRLNPKNKQLNKKIIREVKLLSRLNHENVVRYYNSWIESAVIKEEDSTTTTSGISENLPHIDRKDDFTINDNIEELLPPMKNVEISITYDSKSHQRLIDLNSETSSSEDEDNWGMFNGDESESDGIEFERDPNQEPTKSESDLIEKSESIMENFQRIDYMYIQMEFCEKSTLRNAIDNNLYLDEARMWRLFREIVEGLSHIHQQGMIHRDLKPVNIFLDSEDHVKIGDFGLATTNIKSKITTDLVVNRSKFDLEKEDIVDESKTGLIGTTLYVAPELSVASKAVYNQKVDIYSLGIIFFEMCYKPLSTTMERIKILTGLRKKEIVIPEDFNDKPNIHLVRWLLNHDASKRPTSEELLQSEYIPPLLLEERRFRDLIRSTLNNTHLTGYRYIINSCFNQTFTPAQDITYDRDLSVVLKPLQLYDFVRQTTLKIFKQHGGQNLATPLLMPSSKYHENFESCVRLMTHSGNIVTLPYDLRVPFARYVVWNGITLLRRYSIERVYREKKIFGFIPRELYECAFDIVTPTRGSLIADAEILFLTCEIINELPGVRNKNIQIHLNHTDLTSAILFHFGIKEKQEELYQLITSVKNGKTPKIQLQHFLINFGLSDNSIATFTNLMLCECDIARMINNFQVITRKKSDSGFLAKQALQELKQVIQNFENFGVSFDVIISPGMVYNFSQYSGVMCQIVYETKKKHKHRNFEVIAAGGRYDSMLTNCRSLMADANMLNSNIKQSAVGISISLDKLVQAVQKDQTDELAKTETIDIAVCSFGTKPQIKEKIKILVTLWNMGIKATLIEPTDISEIQEQRAELNVRHIIILKDTEQGIARFWTWDGDRFQEKTFKSSELLENVIRIVRSSKELVTDNSSTTTSRSESKTSFSEKIDVGILFIAVEKLSSNTRKRYENQIRSNLDGLFQRLNGNIVVLAVNIEGNILKTLVSYLEFDNEQQFQRSMDVIKDKHQRYKKNLSEICDEIYEQKMKRSKPIIVLYSLIDSHYNVII